MLNPLKRIMKLEDRLMPKPARPDPQIRQRLEAALMQDSAGDREPPRLMTMAEAEHVFRDKPEPLRSALAKLFSE